MGTYTNFCTRNGGSNLNAGTRTGDTTIPGVDPILEYASGSYVQATGVFTVASGDPAADGVAVGDWASVYADGSTVTGFVGRVTARDATTITVSTTIKMGTGPTDGTNTRTLRIGGAWRGPNSAVTFPFSIVQATAVNAASDPVRVNCLATGNDFGMTAGATHNQTGRITWEGFQTAYGDGLAWQTMKDIGGGASYVLLTLSGTNNLFRNFVFGTTAGNGNGVSGSAAGVAVSAGNNVFEDCDFDGMRGHGISVTGSGVLLIGCGARNNNGSNTAATAGFSIATGASTHLERCLASDNAGSNTIGFRFNIGATASHCIADTSGSHGFVMSSNATRYVLKNCIAYNNAGDGVSVSAAQVNVLIENCIFAENQGDYGVNNTGATNMFVLNNNGFFDNDTAETNGLGGSEIRNSITLAGDPFTDAPGGDFSLNDNPTGGALLKGAGMGEIPNNSFGGVAREEQGFPDVGGAQSEEAQVASSSGSAGRFGPRR